MEKVYFIIMAISLVAWMVLRKKTNRFLVYLGIYLMINFPLELYALYLLKSKGMGSNFFLYHFQLPCEFVCLSIYFFNVALQSITKKWIAIGTTACLFACIINSFFIQPLNELNSNAFLLCGLILTAWAIVNLFEIIKFQGDESLLKLHRFWISIACLIYYPANMFINATIVYIHNNNPQFADRIWTFDYLINTSFYLFIGVAFWAGSIKTNVLHNREPIIIQ